MGRHGAEPPCFKVQTPAFVGEEFRKLSDAREGGKLLLKHGGSAPCSSRPSPSYPSFPFLDVALRPNRRQQTVRRRIYQAMRFLEVPREIWVRNFQQRQMRRIL